MFNEQNFFQRAAKPLQGILQGNGQRGLNWEFLIRTASFPPKVWGKAQVCPVTPQASEDRQHGPENLVLNYQEYHRPVAKYSHYLKLITSAYNQLNCIKNSNKYSDPQNSSLPNYLPTFSIIRTLWVVCSHCICLVK